MNDCLFCKIINGDIPSDIIYKTDSILAFNDINPQAPHHILIIPQKHIPTLNDLYTENKNLVGDMFIAAKKIAMDLEISESGFRVVMNCNADAGQAVFHIHLHLLGGRQMTWPPG